MAHSQGRQLDSLLCDHEFSCPHCHSPIAHNRDVSETRPRKYFGYRRSHCRSCSRPFVTYELTQQQIEYLIRPALEREGVKAITQDILTALEKLQKF